MRTIGTRRQPEEVQDLGLDLLRLGEEPFAHDDGDVIAREQGEEAMELVGVQPAREVRMVLVAEADVSGLPTDPFFLTLEAFGLLVQRLLQPERLVPA